MTEPEDPLAAAIRTYVDGAARPVTAREVMTRPTPTRARRRPLLLVGAGVAVAVAVIGAITTRDTGQHQRVTAGAPVQGGEPAIAALTRDGKVIVVDTRGRELRTLATGIGVRNRQPARLTMPADSATIYTVRPSVVNDPSSTCGANAAIVAIAINDPTPQFVSCGWSPSVSADGHQLAFTRTHGQVSDTLVVRDLRDDTERTWVAGQGITRDGRSEEVLSPHWAPDSRHLAFVWINQHGSYPWLLDTRTAKGLGDAAPQRQSDALGWSGYYGSTNQFLGDYTPCGGCSEKPGIVVFSPRTGQRTKTLFTLPTGGDAASDTTGSRIVVTTGAGDLYLWQHGDRDASKIASGIDTAAWIQSFPTPATSSAAARYIGGLQLCDNGCQQAELSPQLRRTMTIPHITAGAPCPVTTTYARVDPALGDALGDGPVRIVGVAPDRTVGYTAFTASDVGRDPYWGGAKVVIAAAPATGAVLARGYQLDGAAPVGFGDARSNELQWQSKAIGGWGDYVTYLRFQRPGCYGVQFDTAKGSTVVVFKAVGPALDPPLPSGPTGTGPVPIHNYCLQAPLAGRYGYTPMKITDTIHEVGDVVAEMHGLPPSTVIIARYFDDTAAARRTATETTIRSDGDGRWSAHGEGPTLIDGENTVTAIGFYRAVPDTPVGDPHGVEASLGPPAYPC